MELLKKGFDYSDAKVARRKKVSRACVGPYKKELIRMVREDDRFVDFCPCDAKKK